MSEPSDTDAPDTDDGEPAEEKPSRPRKKRKKSKKKRKPKTAATAEAESARPDADGHAPPPANEDDDEAHVALPGEGTVDGDRLREAHRSFEVGDYASVRRLTLALEENAGPEVASAAKALRKRIEIDPIQVVVLSCCAAVVGAIVYVWIL